MIKDGRSIKRLQRSPKGKILCDDRDSNPNLEQGLVHVFVNPRDWEALILPLNYRRLVFDTIFGYYRYF